MKEFPDDMVWQVVQNGTHLQQWFVGEDAEKLANEHAEESMKFWPDRVYEVIQGTDYIDRRCRSCDSLFWEMRYDHYGIPTGEYCDDCYKDPEKYPYRKDDYFDPGYAGERLEPEEF